MEDMASHMDNHAAKINKLIVNKALLKLFKGIYQSSEEKQNEACVALVKHLAENVFSNEGEDLPADLKYCLKRLIRGLGGTQQKLQKSNFTALVAILHSFPSIITYDVFTKIVDVELNGQDVSPGEEGGIFTGRILAYGAAIRSGMFEKSTSDQQLSATKSLITCGMKKSYLSNVASPILLDFIRTSSHDVFVNGVWPVLKEAVAKPWAEQTLDSLLLLVAAMASHPNVVQSKDVKKWLGCRLLCSKAMPYFAEKLLVVNGAVNLEHLFYEEFCNILCSPDHRPMLERFWTVDVADHISTSSKNKELSVLHILSLLLKKIPKQENVYILVTSPVLQMINRILKAPHVDVKRNPGLHLKARSVLSSLEKALASADVSDEEKLKVMNNFCIDSKNQAGARLMNLLENKLSLEGVKILAEQFRNIMLGTPLHDGQPLAMKERMFAAQHLTRLLCLQTCGSDIEWKVEQLSFLAELGLFKGHSTTINLDLSSAVKQCFYRALDQKFSGLEVFSQVLCGVVKHVNKLLSSEKNSTLLLREPFDNKSLSSWQKMFKTILKLEKKGEKGSVEQIFLTLFSFMGLELFADASMGCEILEELQECHLRLQKDGQTQIKSGEPAWMEVTVELLLSFLSRDSRMTRTVVCAVFPHLSRYLTASSFNQILKVLDPAQGENPLSASQEVNDSSDNESEISDDDSKPSNGKMKSNRLNNDKSSDEENSSSSGEESGDTDEEDGDQQDEDEQLIDKLRMELHQALGDSAALTDTESVDVDDLDEEDGERMNAALSQAFKSFSQSKPGGRKKNKEKTKTEETVTHFRIRVLDLVELYISHEPAMALCLEAITPLLNLYAFSTKNKLRKPLEIRVKSILAKLTGLKKFSSMVSVDDSYLAEKIKSLTLKGVKTSNIFLSLADLVVECCTFVVRCSIIISSQNQISEKLQSRSAVVDIYKSLLSEFFSKRDTLLPTSLFKAVFQLNWFGCWPLLNMVVDNALDINVRLFCRRQALILISVIFRNNHLLSSANPARKQELKSIASRLSDHAVEMLNNEGNSSVLSRNSKQLLAELLHCLSQILSRPEGESINKSALSSALSSTACGVSRDLKKALQSVSKMCNCSEMSTKVSKKQKKNRNCAMDSKTMQDVNAGSCNDEVDAVKKDKNIVSNGSLLDEYKSNGDLKRKSVSGNILKKQRKMQKSALMELSLTNGNANVSDEEEHTKLTSNGVSSPFKELSDLKRKSKHSAQAFDHSKKKKKKQ